MALGGQVQIDQGGIEAVVAEILLDSAEVNTGFQEMGGIGMAQCVNGDFLANVELLQYPAQGTLYRGFAHWISGCGALFAVSSQCRKDPYRIAMGLPVLAQQIERGFGQRHIPVLGAFAAVHMNPHELGVNIADLKMQGFV